MLLNKSLTTLKEYKTVKLLYGIQFRIYRSVLAFLSDYIFQYNERYKKGEI